jgi:5-formyltetrahydrofolate cyclo-ligase
MEPSDYKAQKSALRREMAFLRDGLPAEERTIRSREACKLAAAWISASGLGNFMIYAPFRSELDTYPLMEWAWKQEIAVIVPKCYQNDRSMGLFAVKGLDDFTAGAYGIMEPDEFKAAACPDYFMPDAVFVPGIAFDRSGGRLGYGGGYYDRYRARMESIISADQNAPPWIGFGFELQVLDKVPVEPHDAELNGLITERKMYLFEYDRNRAGEEQG